MNSLTEKQSYQFRAQIVIMNMAYYMENKIKDGSCGQNLEILVQYSNYWAQYISIIYLIKCQIYN